MTDFDLHQSLRAIDHALAVYSATELHNIATRLAHLVNLTAAELNEANAQLEAQNHTVGHLRAALDRAGRRRLAAADIAQHHTGLTAAERRYREIATVLADDIEKIHTAFAAVVHRCDLARISGFLIDIPAPMLAELRASRTHPQGEPTR